MPNKPAVVIRVAIVSLALISMLPPTVVAQDAQLYLSPMISRIDSNSEKGYDDDAGWTLGLGAEFHPNWNVEGHVQKLGPGGMAGQDQTAYGVDIQRVFRRDARWSPYLFFGVGILDAELDSSDLSDRGSTASVGIGVLGRVLGTTRAGLRIQYRHRRDDAFSMNGDDGIFSMGLQIPFGRATPPPGPVQAPPVDPDEDDDGVLNAADRCPRTPSSGVSMVGTLMVRLAQPVARWSETPTATACPMAPMCARTRLPVPSSAGVAVSSTTTGTLGSGSRTMSSRAGTSPISTGGPFRRAGTCT